jgi:alkaline phosphatase
LGNENNGIGTLTALAEADAAIGAARAYQADHPHTLIITAADSDGSGLQIVAPAPVTTTGMVRPVSVNPTGQAADAAWNPLDGMEGRGTLPFTAAPDAAGQALTFAVAWSSDGDVGGGILSRAQGLNAELLHSTFSVRFDNTDVYRIMYATIFGALPPVDSERRAVARSPLR